MDSKKRQKHSFTGECEEKGKNIELEKKKLKKAKKKIFENSEFSEELINNDFVEDESLPVKKRKKESTENGDQYKPGMLSDLLQKKKYGILLLPWEKSFGQHSSNGPIRDGEGPEQKIKINPLFDLAKRCEGNIASRNNLTFTVFVGNLPQEVTVNQVKKIFKKIASTIRKIKISSGEKEKKQIASSNNIVNAAMGNCKHATVKFSSLESYEAALKMNGKLHKGHHLRITASKCETKSDPEKSVFVGNLPVGISDDDLWKTFENCGEIDYVRVIRDKLNKKGNFGYINFKQAESVEEALELDGTSLLNRDIRVSRISSNVGSLSDSITVKRKKKRRVKTQPLVGDSGREPLCSVDEVRKKKKKVKNSSEHITLSDEIGQETGPEVPRKKKIKKKNKKLADRKKTSDVE